MRPFSRFHVSPQVTEPQNNDLRQVVLGEPEKMTRPIEYKSEEQAVMDTAMRTLRPEVPDPIPVLVRDEYFSHYQTCPADVRYVATPQSLGLQEGLMSPQARRERLEIQVKNAQARKLQRKAMAEQQHRNQFIKQNYPFGVLGVDGPQNPTTELYKDRAERTAVAKRRCSRTAAARMDRLQQKSSSSYREQRNILAHECKPPLTRARSALGGVRHDEATFGRLFGRERLKWDPKRAQHLRNNEQAGRPYNIVNGAVYEHTPPTIPEKHLVRQAHPSISIHGYVKR